MDRFESKSSSSIVEDIPSRKPDDDKGRSRKTYDVSDSDEAQKKFGGAKAISSDAFFGKYDADVSLCCISLLLLRLPELPSKFE